MTKTNTKDLKNDLLIQDNIVQERIFSIRGIQVMIDRDLSELYGVETKAINQAVKRNIERFPQDFRFQLTSQEKKELVTICDRFGSLKHSSTNPYAYTEHGVLMLANVLKSTLATQVSIRLVKVFVQLRNMLSSHTELKLEIAEIKHLLIGQNKRLDNHDKNIELVFQYLDELAEKKEYTSVQQVERKKIGYEIGNNKK
ncbi:MAG: ORF6N domain-containing protein [Olivibacter sp.]|nr:ORF6N domain-containing protein [Olivibacter sp. UJ_SKK_5.1]